MSVTKTQSQHEMAEWSPTKNGKSLAVLKYPFLGTRRGGGEEDEDYLNNWSCQESEKILSNLL